MSVNVLLFWIRPLFTCNWSFLTLVAPTQHPHCTWFCIWDGRYSGLPLCALMMYGSSYAPYSLVIYLFWHWWLPLNISIITDSIDEMVVTNKLYTFYAAVKREQNVWNMFEKWQVFVTCFLFIIVIYKSLCRAERRTTNFHPLYNFIPNKTKETQQWNNFQKHYKWWAKWLLCCTSFATRGLERQKAEVLNNDKIYRFCNLQLLRILEILCWQ